MGDTTDGSSMAAQRALSDEKKHANGFWSRVFGTKNKDTLEIKEDKSNGPIPAGGLSNLRLLRVTDVAVPRADITAIPLDATLQQVIKSFKQSGYSRLPVFDDVLDNPVGFLHLKDLTQTYGFTPKPPKFNLKKLLRPLLFEPPSMVIGTLLQKMQAERIHMALVIDEYGGVDGLLTIEDLIEQVVGEISDEHDTEEAAPWVEGPEGVYSVNARANLEEFEAVLGVDLLNDNDDEDIDTVGGLVFMLSGRVPARGEVVCHDAGFEFEVLDADPRRLKRVRVSKST